MNEEEFSRIIEILKDLPYSKKSAAYSIAEKEEVINKAIENMRYKPVILQEHDAEPRRLKAVLDTKTMEVYVKAALTGFTIEEGEE